MAGTDTKDKKDQLPKLSDWKAPWEVDKDTGVEIPEDDQKIDPAQLKRYLHGLLSDKIKLRSDLTETTARAEELEQKVSDATDPKQIETLQADLAKARQERDEAAKNAGDKSEVLKYKIALRKGLTEVQARRLVGSTEEELEQDAEELLESFGATAGGGSSSDDGETVRKGPKRRTNSAGDPDPDAPPPGSSKDDDPEEVYKKWLASH